MGSENMVLVRRLQIGAKDLTVTVHYNAMKYSAVQENSTQECSTGTVQYTSFHHNKVVVSKIQNNLPD